MHLLLRNSHIISPEQNINGQFDILIINGIINKMGVIWQHVREVIEIDMTGKILVPGFFDMHVHFREPGQTEKEDIKSGALAAAYGGFTGVLCMPNTNPPVDNKILLKQNLNTSKDNIVNVYHSACASINRNGKEAANIKELYENGALAITDDGSPIEDEGIMREALKCSVLAKRPVMQHCEISSITDGGIINEGAVSKKLGVKGIPSASEYKIIERDIELTREIKGSHYHVQHISTKEGVELVRKAKSDGLNVTAEACPHHFILTDDDVLKYTTQAKMNPPLRSQTDRAAILGGLKDGTIDAICTDHAPHTSSEKAKNLEEAPFGIVGLETAIGLSYTYLVEKDIISFEEMINKMSVNPRRILNLPTVKIEEGVMARLTILDINKEWKVDVNKMHSKSRNTPFNGWELKCKSTGIVNNCQHLMYE